jgi:hypothetical protein
MSPFEFVFSLFGLLLGFSLVEVLQGLVRTVKLRGEPARSGQENIRIGWLTPLLGVFVMADLTSFWNNAYRSQADIPANFAALLMGLAITGLYYFSASMVFPDKPEEWPDFDAWAAKHKRQVIGGIFACNVIVTTAALLPHPDAWVPRVIITNAVLLTMMAIAALARPRWLTGAMLIGMLCFYFWYAWNTIGR